MKSHFLKENDVVLYSRWQFQDGRSKGMGTEWDKEVVGKVDPQKRVLCLAQGLPVSLESSSSPSIPLGHATLSAALGTTILAQGQEVSKPTK